MGETYVWQKERMGKEKKENEEDKRERGKIEANICFSFLSLSAHSAFYGHVVAVVKRTIKLPGN